MRWAETLDTEEAPTPKVYKNMSNIWWPISGLATPKAQNTLRFKRNFRNSPPTQLEGTKKAPHVLVWTRWQCRYLRSPLREHETPRKQARNRSKGDLDAALGPNPPSKKAKWDQIPFLQHIYIYIRECKLPRGLYNRRNWRATEQWERQASAQLLWESRVTQSTADPEHATCQVVNNEVFHWTENRYIISSETFSTKQLHCISKTNAKRLMMCNFGVPSTGHITPRHTPPWITSRRNQFINPHWCKHYISSDVIHSAK